MSEPVSYASKQRRSASGMRGFAVGIFYAFAACLAFGLASHGALLLLMPIAGYGLVVGVICEGIGQTVFAKKGRRWRWKHRLALAAIIAAIPVGYHLYCTRSSAMFAKALAAPPPKGVRQFRSAWRYMGPGDFQIELRFQADRTTVDSLVAGRSMTRLDWLAPTRASSGSVTWKDIWRVNYWQTPRAPWGDPGPIARPERYQWEDASLPKQPSVTLIYDPDREWAYVVYLY